MLTAPDHVMIDLQLLVGLGTTTREEIVAYMIYLEGPRYPEHVIDLFCLKYSWTPNMGTCQVILSQLALPNKQQKVTCSIRVVHNKGICSVYLFAEGIPRNTSGNNFQRQGMCHHRP